MEGPKCEVFCLWPGVATGLSKPVNLSYTDSELISYSGSLCFLLYFQVRDKEEELEVAMQKIDSLRHELRKSEKARREVEARVEDAISETNKVPTY